MHMCASWLEEVRLAGKYAAGHEQPRRWLHAGEVTEQGFAELEREFGEGEVALCIGCAGGTAEKPTGTVVLIRATPENLKKAWFPFDEEELLEAGLAPAEG